MSGECLDHETPKEHEGGERFSCVSRPFASLVFQTALDEQRRIVTYPDDLQSQVDELTNEANGVTNIRRERKDTTMSQSEQTMPREQCVHDVRLMARRTALLYHYFVTTLIEHLGEEKAKALTSEAIQRYGEHIGRRVRQGVEEMGLTNDVENYGKYPDLPSVGWEGMTTETEHGPRMRVVYCPLAAVWKELDAEELGRMYCYVDQAKYRAFNPQAALIHTCNVLDGDAYCEFDIRLEEKAGDG